MKRILKDETKRMILYGICMIISTSLGTAFSFCLAEIMNKAIGADQTNLIRVILIAFVVFVSAQIFEFLSAKIKYIILKKWDTNLHQVVFEETLQASVKEIEEKNSAFFLNRITADCDLLKATYFENIFLLIECVAQIVIVSIAVIYTNIVMMLVMILLTAATVWVMKIGEGKLQEIMSKYAENKEGYVTFIKEYISNFLLVKTYDISDKMQENHNEKLGAMQETEYQQKMCYLTRGTVAQSAGLGTTLIIMAVSGWMALQGMVSVGFVLASGQLIGKIIYPTTVIPNIMMNFQGAKPIIERLNLKEHKEDKSDNGEALDTIKQVKMEHVSYSYGEEQADVISDLSLNIENGKKYLVVGESGSGKSTVLALLADMYDNYRGSIMVNGKEISGYKKTSYFKDMGYLTQDVLVLNDTLRNNLTLYGQYSDAEVEAALEKAGLSADGEYFKNGLDSQIEENGKNFSGGEKQRIALARVFLHKPSFLLFDEFTANLDNEKAVEIEKVLLAQNATVVAVAHRLHSSSLPLYDEIIVMEKGQIIEQGSYEELCNLKKKFYAMMLLNE